MRVDTTHKTANKRARQNKQAGQNIQEKTRQQTKKTLAQTRQTRTKTDTNLVHPVPHVGQARKLAHEISHPLGQKLRRAASLEALINQAYHPVVVDVTNASPQSLKQTIAKKS